ncbi:MAG TPA: glycosyltransferase [Acidimicrobiales bacterium]|nr:glycosyltransferase [Acidimicrobiales bacterium]
MNGPAPAGTHRALILSGSIGKGHDVVAEACADALASVGWDSDIVDCMALLGGGFNEVATGIMKGLMAVPGAYDALHFGHLRTGSRLGRGLDRAAAGKLVGPLRRMLAERPADLLVSVFATGGAVVDRLKREQPRLRSVVYCTDACPHRLWVHAGTDLFIVTSDMSAGFIRYHRPGAEVAVVPPAVRTEFHRAPGRDEARHSLGLPTEGTCVLLMAGAWGMAPLDRLAGPLADAGHHVLVVAGNNERLHQRLVRHARPGVVPFGFTTRIPELMAAADLVITTAGDTCTEARTVGRPMLLLDTVPGHGRENLQLELARGGAAATSGDPRLVAAAATALLAGGGGASSPTAVPEGPEGPEGWARRFVGALAPLGLNAGGADAPTP